MVLFKNGFEEGDYTAWTGTAGTPTIVHAPVHHGAHASETDNWGDYCYETLADGGERYIFLAVEISVHAGAGNVNDFLGAKRASDSFEVFWVGYLDDLFSIKYRDVGAAWHTDTSDKSVVEGSYHTVKVWWKKNTAGGMKLWIDDVLEITASETTCNADLGIYRFGNASMSTLSVHDIDCVCIDSADILADPYDVAGVTVKKGSNLANTMTTMLNSKMLFSQCNRFPKLSLRQF